MQKLFNKILVPVDFSARSKNAVLKAIEVAKQYQCSIDLLHVVHVSAFASLATTGHYVNAPALDRGYKYEVEFQFQKLFSFLKIIGIQGIRISQNILAGSWDETIIDYANLYETDLILIGQKVNEANKRKMYINPDKIAIATNIPVITIPSNRRLTKLYSIVIPVTDFLPIRKMMYGIYIASTHNTTIKLLGIGNEKTKDKVQHYMKRARQLVTENCPTQVEEDFTENRNIAEAINKFATMHAADLIILNPGTQTKMPGFMSAFFGNIIQKYSTPPVLTVNAI
ncbi:MAG: universal stress protein [Bacteroidetes bacterium]|nr:universal stress protein [Bacteroidota bacterium]